MGKILWLASYPKSGNTWLRAFLCNYAFGGDKPLSINELHKHATGEMAVEHYQPFLAGRIADHSLEEVAAVRPEAHRRLAAGAEGVALIKTHNRYSNFGGTPTITRDVTAGAIYVMRNPLDMVVSFANYYGMTLDDAIETTGKPAMGFVADDTQVYQDLGSWSGHVESWLAVRDMYTMFIRYEAMIENPHKVFGEVLKFMGHEIDRQALNRAIEFSSFGVLAGQERSGGFLESSPKSRDGFFRQGKAGTWRDVLTETQAKRVVELHRATMRKVRYLNHADEPVV